MREWKKKRVKDFLSFCSGDTLSSDMLAKEGAYPVYGGNGIRGHYDKFNREGSYILVGRVGALCGNIHNVKGKFWATEHALIGTPISQFEIRWLSYLLEDMNLGQYSIASAQPVLSISKINRLECPMPSLAEQKAIADYLDKECGNIDNEIELLGRKADAYKRLRRSIINRAVNRGLNPNANFKSYNIIQPEWKEFRAKDVALTIGSGTTPKSSELRYYNEPFIPWINSGDLNDRLIKSASNYISKDALHDYPNLRIYPKGSIIVAMYGASIGKTGILDFASTVNQACCVIVPDEHLISKDFLFLVLQLSNGKFLSESMGGTQPNISQKIVRDLLIVIPPIEEQEKILDYLDEKCGKIDTIIEKIEAKIERLKELKRSLIDETVTGKRAIINQ